MKTLWGVFMFVVVCFVFSMPPGDMAIDTVRTVSAILGIIAGWGISLNVWEAVE